MSEHLKHRAEIHRRILELHAKDAEEVARRATEAEQAALGAAFVAGFAALLPTDEHLTAEIDTLIAGGATTTGEIAAALEAFHPSTTTHLSLHTLIRGRLTARR